MTQAEHKGKNVSKKDHNVRKGYTKKQNTVGHDFHSRFLLLHFHSQREEEEEEDLATNIRSCFHNLCVVMVVCVCVYHWVSWERQLKNSLDYKKPISYRQTSADLLEPGFECVCVCVFVHNRNKCWPMWRNQEIVNVRN